MKSKLRKSLVLLSAVLIVLALIAGSLTLIMVVLVIAFGVMMTERDEPCREAFDRLEYQLGVSYRRWRNPPRPACGIAGPGEQPTFMGDPSRRHDVLSKR